MTTLQTKLFAGLEKRKAEMIAIRRYLHENPELSFHETNTAQYIENFYQEKNCKVTTHVGGGNGIIVDIKGGIAGPTIAIRADFDALPIQENTGLSFASKVPSVMHACGHDGHTAYMMILADSLIEMKEEIAGTIRILHQPAEEVPPGGAKGMIEAGCLEGVSAVLGIHVMSTEEVGCVYYHKGAIQTGRATFNISFLGKGGHGSMPQEANDAIVAASQFVTAVQTIVSRRLNPFDTATVTIGSFDGKGSANIIKENVTLTGDVRVMKEETRDLVEKEFHRILDGICKAFNITYKLDYQNDYPVLINDYKITDMVISALAQAKIPVKDCGPQTPSEDFAYYALKKPSCFFYVGAHKKGTLMYPHHNPKFYIDESCLEIAAKAMGSAVLYYLSNEVKA